MNTTATERCPSPTYAPDAFDLAYAHFLQNHPTFDPTDTLRQWRATDYKRLDTHKQIYLDYTGGGLYAQSQLEAHMALLNNAVLGNPHSANPTSLAMTALVEEARAYILRYFNASPDEYVGIFTPNASGALKLVGESYPFAEGGTYLLTFDNHNSVNGIREYAHRKGAACRYVPLTTPQLRLDRDTTSKMLSNVDARADNLFAFPAQSNFSGVKHPLDLIEEAHSQGWDVLLDAAAFVPTNRLDLGRVKPDYVCLSFYKMFGYPTGLGMLLCHKTALKKLKRPWFAGGTVNFASVRAMGHYLADDEAGFEDGTINYLNIPAIKIGLEHIDKVGIDAINRHVHDLTAWLLRELLTLKHSNGKPLVRFYGSAETTDRGGTITFNFYCPNATLLDYERVEALANERGISLRTGCFCNPGADEIAEGLTREDMMLGFQGGASMNLSRFVKTISHHSQKSAGAIRISVGIASNFADVYRFMNFAAGFCDKNHLSIGDVTFDIEGCRKIRTA